MSSVALALRPLEFFLAQYRRVWRGTAVTSVVTPVVYLLALGWGLGQFLNDVTVEHLSSHCAATLYRLAQ